MWGQAGSLRGGWPIDNRPQLTKLPHKSALHLAYTIRHTRSPTPRRACYPLLGMTLALLFLAAAPWTAMFDGKSLDGWRETPFANHGKVSIGNSAILLGAGDPLTGITWTKPFPASDYEIRFEAARRQGSDFFAALTFPVGRSHCTWVMGGWGGDIVGLSSIDGWDASENETRSSFNFEIDRWYAFRLEVRQGRIRGWIDDQPVFNVEIGGREIGLRFGEIRLSAPVGFASYGTTGALRKIEYRK